MVLVADRVFNVICSKQIDGVFTKGIMYQVLCTTETDDKTYYEIINDKEEYTRVNAKYFMELI